jgi:hypothetical protein
MRVFHIALGIAALVPTAAATLLGAWCWWRVQASRWFWRLLRTGQALVVVEALDGGILRLTGHRVSGLHLLYGLLPLAISLIAEQFRISATQMTLDARELPDARAVAKLPAAEQRELVQAIIRREIGVMTLAALVIVVLIARAASVH